MNAEAMQRMLADIETETRLTAGMTGLARMDPGVMQALAGIPREEFVPPRMRPHAYQNGPLPIGHDQTISQPFIVALMTTLLRPRPGQRILEIGTGSGYQTAVLACLVERVYSIECVTELSESARRILDRLDYRNAELSVGDGYRGWPEHAPYDGIIVTAAAAEIPPALPEQLAPGGRLVIPVGLPYGRQELQLIEKDREGELHTTNILPVAFVPLLPGDTAGDTD